MPLKINGASTGSVTLAAPDSGSDVILNLPSSNATIATTANTYTFDGVSPSNRNRIINGSFAVWQRGTSVKFNSGQGAYAADRWCGSLQYQNSRTQRVSVTNPHPEMITQYALRASSSTTTEASNGTRIRVGQTLESIDCFSLRNKTVTLSFWIRFSNSTFSSVSNSTNSDYGNFSYNLWNLTSTTDGPSNTTGPDSMISGGITNGSLPTTWTKYTLTGTLSSSLNNVSVVFTFGSLGSTASADTNWYEITQVQLEVGDTATEFEHLPFGVELARCQRYYEKSYDYSVAPGTVTDVGSFRKQGPQNSFGITGEYTVEFAVEKRTNPTVTYYSPNNGAAGFLFNRYDASGNTANRNNGLYANPGTRNCNFGVGSGVGIGYYLPNDSTFIKFQWTASAEL